MPLPRAGLRWHRATSSVVFDSDEERAVISDQDLVGLSDNQDEAFVQFERLARGHLDQTLHEEEARGSGVESRRGWQYELEYMSVVIGAAKAYGIDGIKDRDVPSWNSDDIGTIYQ